MRSLRALARELHLSPATVSRALAGRPHVHQDVRARVLAAAAEAGIAAPQAGAASGRRLVAAIVGDGWISGGASSPLAELLSGATQGARQAGAHLATVMLDQPPSDGLANHPSCARLRPSAALLVNWTDNAAIAAAAQHLPCVLVGQTAPDITHIGIRCATFDASDGVLRLLDHLCALGHSRIAMLSDSISGWRGAERYGAAVAAATFRQINVAQARLHNGTGWERVRKLHRSGITGWIADSQASGYALINHLVSWGARVPDQVSVCSFSFTQPPPGSFRLTGMRGDWRAVGRIAARWALTRPDPTDPVTRLLVHSRVESGNTTTKVTRRTTNRQ